MLNFKLKMDNLAKWFLKQKPLTIFLLSFLGIPFYLWLFSINYQLDKFRNVKDNKSNILILYFLTIYPIIYMICAIVFTMFSDNPDTFFYILPFHILAMLFSLILMIKTALSIKKFERFKGYKKYDTIVLFFCLGIIFGIFILQPDLNKYIDEKI